MVIILLVILIAIGAYMRFYNMQKAENSLSVNERMSYRDNSRIDRFFQDWHHSDSAVHDTTSEWIIQKRIDWENGIDGYGNPRTDKEWLKAHGKDITRVIIEPPSVDASKIEFTIVPIPKFEFRPTRWNEFIGQSQAKERVKVIEEQFRRGMRAHIMLSAIRGHGKSSFVQLLAKDMDMNLIERIGSSLNVDTLVDVINLINASDKPSLFFLDEIDSCPKEMIKMLNPIIESFQISGKRIKPFLFACASINNYLLYKNNPDTVDRIAHKIIFTRYSIDELTIIIKQVHKQLYKDVDISDDDLRELAKNSKVNPRTAINLLEYFVVDQDIEHILETNCIVKDGLTLTDVKILDFLAGQKKAIGANAVAMKIGVSQREYENEHEPYLFEFGYVNRLPSRVITDKGRAFLQSIHGLSNLGK